MASGEWWVVTAGVALLVLACALLALGAGRRVGLDSPYGALLGLFALSYWLIFGAYLAFGVPTALGLPPREDVAVEALDIIAWAIQLVALAILASRFSSWQLRNRRVVAALVVLVPALGTLGLYLVAHGDHASLIPMIYMVLDGACIGLILLSVIGFRRVRNDAIGRLYFLLLLAMGLKAIGEFLWYTGSVAFADPIYLLAALFAVAAWTVHFLATRRVEPADGFASPHLRPEQRVLRESARHARSIAGAEAGLLVLASAGAELARYGIPHRIAGDILEADAPESAWREALASASARVSVELGEDIRDRLIAVAAAFGDEYAEAMRGRPA